MWTVEIVCHITVDLDIPVNRADYLDIRAPTMAALLDRIDHHNQKNCNTLAYRRLRYNGRIQNIKVLRVFLENHILRYNLLEGS